MKKFFSLLAALLLCASLIVPAAADVLWEPFDNDYYMNDYDNCLVVARIYGVPEGMTVSLYESPEGGEQLATLEAGTRVYVGFSKTVDGQVWGVGYPLGDWKNEGWFRLGRLQLEYDHEAFLEDPDIQISAEALVFDCKAFTDPIPTWTYPGSGILKTTLECDWNQVAFNDGKLECSLVYIDPDGGKWGYIGYFMGPCGWMYLDDPYSENPPSFPREPENTVTDRSPTEENPDPDFKPVEYIEQMVADHTLDRRDLGWVIALVAAVTVVTALLILGIKHRK